MGYRVSPLLLAALAIAVVAVGGFYYKQNMKNPSSDAAISPTATATATSSIGPTSSPDAATVKPVTDPGVTWLAAPEKLADLGLLKFNKSASSEDAGGEAQPIGYYKVGDDNGQSIIIADTQVENISPGLYQNLFYFLKTKNGKYERLTAYEPINFDNTKYQGFEQTGVAQGTNDKVYKSLIKQETLTVKGATLKAVNDAPWFPTLEEALPKINIYDSKRDLESVKKVSLKPYSDTAYGKLYSARMLTNSGYDVEVFLLRRFDQTTKVYDIRPDFIKDDNIPAITWKDGTKNTDSYRLDYIGGCGFPFGVGVIDTIKKTDLVEAGKTNTGEIIYDFANSNQPALKKFYDLYDEFGRSEKGVKQLNSIDEYRTQHGVIVYIDKLNRNVILINTSYGPNAECGGPYYRIF